ncbi:MAG: hypothetical protein FGF47_01195 [Candidatus Brockarchaeota archaeon]|nr:hypothetical protein [Candidatus Brockarchaeota archaeon]
MFIRRKMYKQNWVYFFYLFFVVTLFYQHVLATVYEDYNVYLSVNIQFPSQTVRIVVDVLKPKNVTLDPMSDSLLWYANVIVNGIRYNQAIAGGNEAIYKSNFNFTFTPGQVGTPNVVDFSQVVIYIEANWNRWGQNTNPLALQHYYVHLVPYYYVKVSSSYGDAYGSGFYKVGSEIHPSLNSSVISFNNGTKLVLVGWKVTDGLGNSFSIASKDSFIVRQVTTVEAIWKKYFLVKYNDVFNSTEVWEEANSRVTFSAKSEVYITQDIRYNFIKFFINSTSQDVLQNPYTCILSSPIYVSGMYKKEFKVSITSIFGTINGSSSGWYEDGSLINCSVSPIIINASNEERFRFIKWSVSIPAYVHSPLQINATWIKEVFIQIDKYDNTHIVYNWYSVGSSLNVETTSVIDYGNSTRSVFVTWSDGVVENPRYLAVSQPICIREIRDTEYTLTFEPFYPVFKVYNQTLSNNVQWIRKGTIVKVSMSSNVYEVTEGKRYRFLCYENISSNSSSVSFIMNGPVVIKSVWITEYYVNFTSPFSFTKNSGWYPEGSKVYPSIESKVVDNGNTRWIFVGWSTQVPIVVNSQLKVSALWTRQVYVDVVSEYSTSEGSGWYNENSLVKLTMDKTSITLRNGTKLIFTGWLVNSSFVTQKDEIVVDGPTTVKALWKVIINSQSSNNSNYNVGSQETNQDKSKLTKESKVLPLKLCKVIVLSNFSEPKGSGTYAEGETANVYLTNYTVYLDNTSRYVFSRWNFVENGLSTENRSLSINVNSNLTIVAIWKKQVFVNSTWYDEDKLILLHAPVLNDITSLIRKRFVFWLLKNGSKFTSNNVLLKASDALGAKSIYTIENALLFKLCSSELKKVNILLDFSNNSKVTLEVYNNTKLWFKNDTVLNLKLFNDSIDKVAINGTKTNELKLNMSQPKLIMFSALLAFKNDTSIPNLKQNEASSQNNVVQIMLIFSAFLNLYFIFSRFLLPFYQKISLKQKVQDKLLIKTIKKKY